MAFGPQTFPQNVGKPVPIPFTVLDPTTTYTLRVDNKGVTSGTIKVNGVVVVAPKDFGKNVTLITKSVTLLATNQVTVEFDSTQTASLVLQIIGVDNVPPTITTTATPSRNAAGWNNSNVTVTFSCFDKTSGVASCSAPVTITTEGANQVVTGRATDKAGNTATASVTVNLDKMLPSISPSSNPPPNAAGWNNSDIAVGFTCSDALSGIDVCPTPVMVTTETAGQMISGTARDKAGNSATASTTVKLDKTPPLVTITSPGNGTTVTTPGLTVNGTVSDALSGVAGVSCNGTPGVITSGAYSCTLTLTAGANAITVRASDVAGNSTTATVNINFILGPTLHITSPTNLSFLNTSPITVNGTVSDPAATLTVNGIPTPQSAGSFSVSVPLLEGNNTITGVATNGAGNVGTASIQVTLDTTPPRVTIDSPIDGFVVTDSSVTVTGKINDTVVGTVNPGQATVAVNSLLAQVANRGFVAAGIPLALGDNTIRAVGRDQAGNSATAAITVRRIEATQPRIVLVSGNNQTGVIGSELTTPLVAQVLDATGTPVANQTVIFNVTQNNGTVRTVSGQATTLTVPADTQGKAQVFWTLGMRSGPGNMVEATAAGFTGVAVFTATGSPTSAARINMDAGSDQTGAVGQLLPHPFIAVVTDAAFNRVPNVPVTFTVKQGNGGFNAQASITSNTDSDGRAAAILTLGSQDGIENNVVEASFPGNLGFPAAFTSSGRIPGDPAATRITGVVLDNSNAPVPGVTIRAFLNNAAAQVSLGLPPNISVQADAQGQFTIQPAPVGFVKLIADGSTAQRPGTWPNLEYELVTVAGQNNPLGLPIYLLPLDTAHGLCVTPTTGGTLTLPLVPGFSLTVQPGSAIFPGGSRTGCVSVTTVHPDKIPMPPGFGQQPRFIVTIQPAGTVFSPPAAITIPNAEGLASRTVTEMYSFDHDLGTFVSIGTGTVSGDGTVISSDLGVGVLKAGWLCGGNPSPTGSAGTCAVCQRCVGSLCVTDHVQDGMPCTQPPQIPGVCNSGRCCQAPSFSSLTITKNEPTDVLDYQNWKFIQSGDSLSSYAMTFNAVASNTDCLGGQINFVQYVSTTRTIIFKDDASSLELKTPNGQVALDLSDPYANQDSSVTSSNNSQTRSARDAPNQPVYALDTNNPCNRLQQDVSTIDIADHFTMYVVYDYPAGPRIVLGSAHWTWAVSAVNVNGTFAVQNKTMTIDIASGNPCSSSSSSNSCVITSGGSGSLPNTTLNTTGLTWMPTTNDPRDKAHTYVSCEVLPSLSKV